MGGPLAGSLGQKLRGHPFPLHDKQDLGGKKKKGVTRKSPVPLCGPGRDQN